MKRTILFWIIAIISTLVFAVYQRVTGPTYPISDKVNLAEKEISYKLERSQETGKDYKIEIETDDEAISGILFWRKFNSGDDFKAIQMTGSKKLSADLPFQKRLEKLDYYIQLSKNNQTIIIPKEKVVTIRFKDPVPIVVLIPHIFTMFFAMMLSTRTGLEFFNKEPRLEKLALWTIIILFIGGFPLGFAMNGYAFGEMWGGWPFGHDVTDNKTQVAFIAWLVAFYFIKQKKNAKLAALLAAVIMLAVYLIPHSV